MVMLYTYNITLTNRKKEESFECKSVREAVNTINDHIGLDLVTCDSFKNYFTRPDVASKRVFGKIVNATRVPRRAKRVIPYANLPHAECTSSPSHSPN
jgi:hypothetical protein|eukprot:COSAG01_NODE_13019_length_1648_cov_2.422208_2_plen_98_part_00